MKTHYPLESSRFRDGIDERSSLKPLPTAVIISTVYVALISLYILVSGRIASSVSETVVTLENIEIIKGLVFVFVSGGMLFLAAYVSFDKIAKQDNLIIAQNKSIIASERLAMAGIFCSSVCHDINNIMSVIVGHAQFLKDSEALNGKEREWSVQIMESSNRLTELVRRMMTEGKGYLPGQIKHDNLSRVI